MPKICYIADRLDTLNGLEFEHTTQYLRESVINNTLAIGTMCRLNAPDG
jgi:hypothetical protein